MADVDDRQRRRGTSRAILGAGREPDPRFSLANERTFLAWIRTSLALFAGGVGLEAFAGSAFPAGVRTALVAALLGTGMMLAASATIRWVQIERAMRQDRPLPLPWIGAVLALGVSVALGVFVGHLL
ncbi:MULTISPECIES: YidH family protein [unclassified Luteococcus]|uniref:YidH family protein n=1 Tax=unclassified Luteococcus TaxID=2639923 RepID=UPI00313D1100